MDAYQLEGKSYSTYDAAVADNPDAIDEPTTVTLDPSVVRRELGNGQLVEVPQVELDERNAAQAAYDALQWARDRQAAYASLEEQLDMLYWDMKSGTTTFVDHRDAVKSAHPKPA